MNPSVSVLSLMWLTFNWKSCTIINKSFHFHVKLNMFIEDERKYYHECVHMYTASVFHY